MKSASDECWLDELDDPSDGPILDSIRGSTGSIVVEYQQAAFNVMGCPQKKAEKYENKAYRTVARGPQQFIRI